MHSTSLAPTYTCTFIISATYGTHDLCDQVAIHYRAGDLIPSTYEGDSKASVQPASPSSTNAYAGLVRSALTSTFDETLALQRWKG